MSGVDLDDQVLSSHVQILAYSIFSESRPHTLSQSVVRTMLEQSAASPPMHVANSPLLDYEL